MGRASGVSRLCVLFLSAGGAASLLAQSSSAYLFTAPGAATASGASVAVLHSGAGFEIRLPAGFGIGAEAGVLSNLERSGLFPIASVNGYYHFVHDRSRRVDAFATGGYTALVSDGLVDAFNVGAGVNWWFARRSGLKLEFRDHITQTSFSILSTRSTQSINLPEFRIGIAFR